MRSTNTLRLAFLLLAAFAFLSAGCDKSAGADASPDAVRRKAQECAEAMMKADYGTVVDLTHPKIVELIGGRHKMVETIKSGMDRMKTQGFSITAYTVEAPAEVIGTGPDRLAIVPTSLEMKAPSAKIKQKAYLLAVSSDGGKHWTFIDGSGLDAEKLKMVLPDAPKDFKLPPATPPVVEKT